MELSWFVGTVELAVWSRLRSAIIFGRDGKNWQL